MRKQLNIEQQKRLVMLNYELDRRKQLNPLSFFEPIDHPELPQAELHKCGKRNINAFGGNKSGKTMNGAAFVLNDMLQNPGHQWWCGTWADMSLPIQQTEIYNLMPKDPELLAFASFNEKRGFMHKIFRLANDSKARFKTYEQGWRSWQGARLHGIWLDEEAPLEILKEAKARLMDNNGILLRTMTPLDGITYTYEEVVINENNDKEVQYWFWDSTYNPHIDQTARERILSGYGSKEEEVRRKGHFLNLRAGQVYYEFNEEDIIDHDVYLPNRPLEISCDFNVDLMCWTIGQETMDVDYEFDEIEMTGQANTDLLCKMLKDKTYPVKNAAGEWSQKTHSGNYIFYCDFAGSHRDPSAAKTSIAIIQENFPQADIYYQNIRNIKDRTDALNGRLKNRKTKIHRRCKRLIKDLRLVTWEMLLNKNKAGELTHSSDGASYKYHWKYPLLGKIRSKQW